MNRKKILIVKFGQIGDVIMAIPAAYLLHEQGHEIHWVCGYAVQSLLASYSWIHVLPADDKVILFGGLLQRVEHILKLWRRLAFQRYDLCAVLYYDRRYRLLTLPVWAHHKLMLSNRSRKTTLIPGRHHTDEYTRILLNRDDTCKEQSTPPVRPDRLQLSSSSEKRSRRIVLVPGGVNHLVREQATSQLPEQALRRCL